MRGAATPSAAATGTAADFVGAFLAPVLGDWHSGGRTTIVQGDTIIGGTSSTTIIRKVIHRDGDTIIVVWPDPHEPCGCVEQPEPQPSPVSIEAGTGALLIAALVMMRATRRKRRG